LEYAYITLIMVLHPLLKIMSTAMNREMHAARPMKTEPRIVSERGIWYGFIFMCDSMIQAHESHFMDIAGSKMQTSPAEAYFGQTPKTSGRHRPS
jgi:hypothetical protein